MAFNFDSFTVHSEYSEEDYGGFVMRAIIIEDYDSDESTDEDMAPEVREAWRRGDWHYVGIRIDAYRKGRRIKLGAASVYGVACNLTPDNIALVHAAQDLLPEALEAALEEMALLHEATAPFGCRVSPAVAAGRMAAFAIMDDKEASHVAADGLLCTIAEGAGYDIAASIFRDMDKWYA